MGCHFLLQEIFLTQESNLGLLHCRRILYQLSYKWSLRFRYYVLSNTLRSSLILLSWKCAGDLFLSFFLSFFFFFLSRLLSFGGFFLLLLFVCFCCSDESTYIMFLDLEEQIFQVSHFTVNTCFQEVTMNFTSIFCVLGKTKQTVFSKMGI